MGGVIKGIVSGTADHFTIDKACNFEVCGDGIHLFQGYARIRLPRAEIKVFAQEAAKAARKAVNDVPEAAKPALEEMADRLFKVAEQDALKQWEDKQ
jgi:hypothetical protein